MDIKKKGICFFRNIISIILILISLFPIFIVVRIGIIIFAGISLLTFLIFLYFYIEFSKNNGELQHKIRNIVLEKLNWNGNGKALDIGTGSGTLAINLAKRFQNAKVLGIDYWGVTWSFSKKMCEKNANLEGVGNRVVFEKADASNLPFNNEEFDVVVSSFVFHEISSIKDKKSLIKEAMRVLKKNGAFSIMDTFNNKRTYGNIEELKKEISKFGVKEIYYSDINTEIKLKRLMRITFKNSGLFYGQK